MAIDITALYCCLDDFCKVFEDWEAHRLIPSQTTRQRTGKLSRSEMLFIMVLFHLSPFKHFKVFYHYGIGQQHRACFRELPHYDRFVGLMPRLLAPLMVLLHSLSGAQTGIYFADSTKLAVCHNRRLLRRAPAPPPRHSRQNLNPPETVPINWQITWQTSLPASPEQGRIIRSPSDPARRGQSSAYAASAW